jgi:hypothetical protein
VRRERLEGGVGELARVHLGVVVVGGAFGVGRVFIVAWVWFGFGFAFLLSALVGGGDDFAVGGDVAL